jgi:lysophospholipase L1-like esterase
MPRALVHRLLAVLLALGFAVVAGEIVVRALRLGRSQGVTVDHPLFHHWHPADHEHEVWGGRGEFGPVRARFNSDGFGMSEELPEPGKPSLVFLGDSFTLGLQVPEAERFVSRVGTALPLPALNFGNGSSCPLLSRLQLEHFEDRVTPRAVVLQIYANDLECELRMRREGVWEDARVVAVPGRDNPLWARASRHLLFLRLLRERWQAWSFRQRIERRIMGTWELDPYSALHDRPLEERYSIGETQPIHGSLREIRDLCRERGWPLLLMAIPDRGAHHAGSTDHFARHFERFATEHQIRWIDLVSAFRAAGDERLFFENDPHLTASGHRVVAETLAPALVEILDRPAG